jgi:N-acetyl-gamma-glutamyl-phosphate reductase
LRSDAGEITVGLIGARGHVGRELIAQLDHHPSLRVALAVSRDRAGRGVRDVLGVGPAELAFSPHEPSAIGKNCPDVLVLALNNGHARAFLDEIRDAGARPRLVIDLSADLRDDPDWVYAVPELHPERLPACARIANPGCYATAMMLALVPLKPIALARAQCFGVSGYSGAGATPSERNDTERLRGGVTPYALAAHSHEGEVRRHTGLDLRFAPAVAAFFRGITLTAMLEFDQPVDFETVHGAYRAAFDGAAFVHLTGERIPRMQDIVETPNAEIGGITIHPDNPSRATVVCTLDNLLKGAASQALQNINLALGLPHDLGVLP